MTWMLSRPELDQENLLVNESLFTLGNGYIGVRGNFEEGYTDEFQSIRGTYINAFHDEAEISYGEKLHAFPDTQQKLVNVIDGQTVNIYIDGELFSLFAGEVLDFQRKLHLNEGFSERIIHWRSPKGKEVKLHYKRLVSFVTKELFALHLAVEPVSTISEIKIISTVNGAITNFVDKDDPRVASGHAKLLTVEEARKEDDFSIVKDKTKNSQLEVACVTSTKIDLDTDNYTFVSGVHDGCIEESYVIDGTHSVQFTKLNVYTDTLRHGDAVVAEAINVQQQVKNHTFVDLLKGQKDYLDQFWKTSDIKIGGAQELQEGLRFNLYHLLQSVGKDSVSNIAAKGLTGEGYEGHYFWDTEIYMFPVFLMTNPDLAKNLLLHRYSILDSARARAQEMGHKKGALFPWRTITGTECSAFFPAGTAQYHISADIAYSYIQYYLVTKDEAFLEEYMAEVLFETARLWIDMGHTLDGQFRIDDVTGPDEYTCIVNNNYYTNVMAKHNMKWASKVYHKLLAENEELLTVLAEKIDLGSDEVCDWERAANSMYLPYDEKHHINAQDDSFLRKERWDLENTPKDKFPLLLNYHPLTLYRYQVCKQADTVLAHFLLEDKHDFNVIKNSYDFYEEITTHDSSLSYCVFSIMGSKLGYKEKAYDYFSKTARLDIDNTHGNTKDGLHMANMGGTWLAIVYGFAGLRVIESGLSFTPSLPSQWESLDFYVQYQGRLLKIKMDKECVTYFVEQGETLSIIHYGEEINVEAGKEITVSLMDEQVIS